MTDETTTEQLAEIEGQKDPVQVREGRWRTRSGMVKNVRPKPPHETFADQFVWWDGEKTWSAEGRYIGIGNHELDLLEYLGPIEPQPQPQPLVETIRRLQSRINELETINAARDLIVADADRQNTELRSKLEKANTKVEELQSERDEALYDLSQMGERFTQEEIDLLMVIRRCQKEEQIGGTHYQGSKLQPVTISIVNNLGFIEGNILKYLLRHREKGGRESLEKALNYLKRLISISYPDGPESKG